MDPTAQFEAPQIAYGLVSIVADEKGWSDGWLAEANLAIAQAFATGRSWGWEPGIGPGYFWDYEDFWEDLHDEFSEDTESGGAPEGWDKLTEVWAQGGEWAASFDAQGIDVEDVVEAAKDAAGDITNPTDDPNWYLIAVLVVIVLVVVLALIVAVK